METLKHMERFNTQTHLVHSHSRVSEKRAFAFSTQITLLTLCRNISTLTPEACRRHIQLLPTGQPPMGASSWPWRHYTKHPRGGEQQLIWANLDGFPLLMLRREEKSEFFFFLETMYSSHTRRAEGILIAVHSILKKGSRGEAADLPSLVTSTSTWGNRMKLHQESSDWTLENVLHQEGGQPWEQVPWGIANSTKPIRVQGVFEWCS